MYIHYVFFIYSLIDGSLGCFYILTTANKSAMNMGVDFRDGSVV